MGPVCPLCRAEVVGAGTLLKAGRKPLALVHPACAEVAQRGVALFGKLLLLGATRVLEARAPGVMVAINAARQVVRQQRAMP